MSRRAAKFTQADIFRAIKAAERDGVRRTVRLLSDGEIRIDPYIPVGADSAETPESGEERDIVL